MQHGNTSGIIVSVLAALLLEVDIPVSLGELPNGYYAELVSSAKKYLQSISSDGAVFGVALSFAVFFL